MVYIFTSKFSPIVCKTIDWLSFYKVQYKRINNYFEDFDCIDYKNDFNSSPENINKNFYFFYKIDNSNSRLDAKIHNQLVYEYLFGFFSSIERDKKLGNLLNLNSLSKINVLQDAKKLQIPIPNTIITNTKRDLMLFFEKNNESIITKPCHELLKIDVDNISYRSYTTKLGISEIKNLPNKFGLSLFQENILKKCDIKSVYFNGTFFSQAIFSQENENTRLDFRQYNLSMMPRLNTFKIPNELEKKIESLLIKYKLNFAVVDLILDVNDDLFFLEINVDGVFESVSIDCNYYIEKKIAEYIYEKQTN